MDMIWLEMMKDEDHAPRCVRAAAESKLPVCMGISARTDPDTGEIVLFGNGEDAIPLTKEWFYKLSGMLGEFTAWQYNLVSKSGHPPESVGVCVCVCVCIMCEREACV